MGLAASQARFLGLTARKANCEFRSTELAEEKLALSNQLSQISNDYFNSLNATKLVWQSDISDGGYNVSYGLLMSPSALNDYNPYMVTTKSGAIVLTNEYRDAAMAAGIYKSGGVGTQEGRDKFINSLIESGIITAETAKLITKYDAVIENGKVKKDDNGNIQVNNDGSFEKDADGNYKSVNAISFDPTAGVGGIILDKTSVDVMNIQDIMASESMGQKNVTFAESLGGSITGKDFKTQYAALSSDEEKEALCLFFGVKKEDVAGENNNKLSDDANLTPAIKLDNIQFAILSYKLQYSSTPGNNTKITDISFRLEDDIEKDSIKGGDKEGHPWFKSSEYKACCLLRDLYKSYKTTKTLVARSSLGNDTPMMTLIKNGVVVNSQSTINNLTVADLISDNIVLMQKTEKDSANNLAEITATEFSNTVMNIMRPIFEYFGYGDSTHSVGLNTDADSDEALDYAFKMIQNVYLRPANVISMGKDVLDDNKNLNLSYNNSYQNAIKNNRIGKDEDGHFTAVSLSNIMSAFLTYFGNYTMAKAGGATNFEVAKTVDMSSYVTENYSYTFVGQSADGVLTEEEKIADFYDQLYNNICAHGWREDDSVSNPENLVASIKNGRYSLSALHDDGYFYQTNYLSLDYLTEVVDEDAIARAEADYTRKKAEITSKENEIDVKSKKLDAEIAALTQEMNSVQNLIQEGTKIFNQFHS